MRLVRVGQLWSGMAGAEWLGSVRKGWAGQVGSGKQGLGWFGMVWQVRRGLEGTVGACFGLAGKVRSV